MSSAATGAGGAGVDAFRELGLTGQVMAAVTRLQLDAPTAVQRQMIPALLAGQDCLVQTRTGSGKTNGYILPMVQRVKPSGGLQALVLVPTRDLCGQIQRNLRRFEAEAPLRVCALLGGRDGQTLGAAPGEADVVVATPRGAQQALSRDGLDLSGVGYLVLDEADALVDPDAQTLTGVLGSLPAQRLTVLIASALDPPVRELAGQQLRDPLEIAVEPETTPMASARHFVVRCKPERKLAILRAFLAAANPRALAVFTADARLADQAMEMLEGAASRCVLLSADRDDHGNRGRHGPRHWRHLAFVVIDPPSPRLALQSLSHAVLLDVPTDPAGYAARVDQCARLSRRGYCVALVSAEEEERLMRVEQRFNRAFEALDAPWIDEAIHNRPGHGGRPARGDGRERGGPPGEARGGSRGGGRGDRHGGPPHRGDRRDGGPRRERPRDFEPHETVADPTTQDVSTSAPASRDDYAAPPPPPPPPAPPALPTTDARLTEPLRRDRALEAQGIQPVRRTLGSRFRPVRNRRPVQRN